MNINFDRLAVFPIYKVESELDVICLADIFPDNVFFQGNGFFISDNGLFSSVAHVFKNKQTLGNNYVFYKNNLYKIFDLVLIDKDFYSYNCIDLAFGKINIIKCEYFNPDDFMDVEISEDLFINGFSKRLSSDCEYFISSNIDINFFRIPATCSSLLYDYMMKVDLNIPMENFFTIIHSNLDAGREGLSGSPVLNNEGKPVGVFKGGNNPDENGFCKGQVLHFKIIKDSIKDI